MKKIMIVGGAGYIGGYLTDLLSQDNQVFVYDNLLYENMYLKEVPFKNGDIRDTEKLTDTIASFGPDVIIWLHWSEMGHVR